MGFFDDLVDDIKGFRDDQFDFFEDVFDDIGDVLEDARDFAVENPEITAGVIGGIASVVTLGLAAPAVLGAGAAASGVAASGAASGAVATGAAGATAATGAGASAGALSTTASVLKATSAVVGGGATINQAVQADRANREAARDSTRQASDIRRAAQQTRRALSLNSERVRSSQRASLGAAGVSFEGLGAQLQARSTEDLNREIEQVLAGENFRAGQLDRRARNQRRAGRTSRITGVITGGVQGVGGGLLPFLPKS